MTVGPLDHAIDFWKPLISLQELQTLASYRDPGEAPKRGINAIQAGSRARSWRIVDGTGGSALFAAVHPIEQVPPSAEVVADILDTSGNHYSYVLWFPKDEALVVPFDPNAAVEAFWHEEYLPPTKRTALPQPLLSFYYSVAKPLLPQAVKRRLRRSMARRALASESTLEWPVDESLDRLLRFLLRLILIASGRSSLQFAWFWPDGHPWAVVLTHDVETADGLANIACVQALEIERGFRSSFNFVPLDYEVPATLLGELDDEGFEVGVHGYTHDGLLFSSWPIFQKRVPTINDFARRWKASGFRSPATYRNMDWLHLLALEYDSSVSNTAPCEPQPGGCGSLFPYLVDSLVELPITLPQDHTLYELLEEPDASKWLMCLGRIEHAHGMACVLTHPDPGSGYVGYDGNGAYYGAVLDFVVGSEAWTPLPRDLARWWRARNTTGLEQIANVEGISFGTAFLGPSGSVEITPPACVTMRGHDEAAEVVG